MNTNLIEKEIVTINSKEVAEMMEMEHSNLIKKINKINKDFNEVKINLVDYWLESSYVDKKGEERKCYEVTKMGCEFLAHKSTGTKGNIFTARYMQKFNEMEKALQNMYIESYRIEDPIERAKKWIEEETVRREQAKLIEEQTPKVEVYDNFVDKEHTLGFRELRKELESTLDITINENRFKDVMREYNLIGKRVKATAFAIRNGFAVTKDVDLVNGGTTTQDRFTMKTRDLLLERYRNN
ncbi:Rha family transcriptional regulator [Fusobacterium sp.]|uniref:Rha family transcriptional regulator n=1 Tax=Fusobacterium sp. TaxID=68766 RepID=UPI002639C54D|nr:Rha family transcriptional regulator [Fusobacterium sp.]